MPTKLSDLKALHGKFAIFSRRGWWKISCYECPREWRLEKKPDLHTGNILKLFDHWAMHDMKRNNPAEYERIQKERNQEMRADLQNVSRMLSNFMRSAG